MLTGVGRANMSERWIIEMKRDRVELCGRTEPPTRTVVDESIQIYHSSSAMGNYIWFKVNGTVMFPTHGPMGTMDTSSFKQCSLDMVTAQNDITVQYGVDDLKELRELIGEAIKELQKHE